MHELTALLDNIAMVAHEAGQAILQIYDHEDLGVSHKADDSPLTRADMAAHRIIEDRLTEMTPEIPVHSEESEGIRWQDRQHWQRLWLVDPLDGTKEFINRNDEFTVNIALVDQHRAVMGVVHVPATGTTYLGLEGVGAWVERNGKRERIRSRTLGGQVTMVASRRHGAEQVDALAERIKQEVGPVDRTSLGSSLKLCLVAEGAADIYPRLSPTAEWDTAAAHAVVSAAGGTVVDTRFQELQYNRSEDVLNPHFLVLGDALEFWSGFVDLTDAE